MERSKQRFPSRRAAITLGATLATALIIAVTAASTPLISADATRTPRVPDQAQPDAITPDAEAIALLEKYCIACHGPEEAKVGLRFDSITSRASALELADDLDYGRERLVAREMPPRDHPQPTEDERKLLAGWMQSVYDEDQQRSAFDPGWFTIHRLNRAEYANTLRDLLDIDTTKLDIERILPPDNVGHGFDNNADVLTISPVHIEAYLDAAERALQLALGPAADVNPTPRRLRPLEITTGGRSVGAGGVYLYSNGAARADFRAPVTAEYEITVASWGQRGGPDLPRLSIRADGKQLAAHNVEATTQQGAQTFKVTARLDAGVRDIAAHFTNDYYVKGKEDRNLAIASIQVAGPLDTQTIDRPDGYMRIMLEPQPLDPRARRDLASRIIDRFASRAFRRPATQTETARYMSLYDSTLRDGDGHEQAVRQMLLATLISPNFLYRNVANPYPNDPARIYTLSDHELASRLSYFLWSSMPDEELRRLADLGLLNDDDVLSAQVARMLEDERAGAFIENFSGQWLLLRNLEDLDIDEERFPTYDEDLRADFIDEATRFFGDVVRRNRPIYDLISARDTFLNARLAEVYGIEGIRGTQLRRVQLPDTSPRGGVLTMGAVLTVTSNPTRTSPVKRGLYVLDQILGSPPPPPPPEIPPLEEAINALGPDASLREQLAAHVADPNCASCHMRMDPLGLAMENFDAIGRFRIEDDGLAIDASGELPSGESFDGPVELKEILLDRRAEFMENLTARVLTYALGRGVEGFDSRTIAEVSRTTTASGSGFGDLVTQIVRSEAFRTSRGKGTE